MMCSIDAYPLFQACISARWCAPAALLIRTSLLIDKLGRADIQKKDGIPCNLFGKKYLSVNTRQCTVDMLNLLSRLPIILSRRDTTRGRGTSYDARPNPAIDQHFRLRRNLLRAQKC